MTNADETTQHRHTILLEQIQSQVQMIAEGQIQVVSRLDSLDFRMGHVEERLDRVDLRLYVMDKKLDQHTNQIQQLSDKVSQNTIQIQQLQSAMTG